MSDLQRILSWLGSILTEFGTEIFLGVLAVSLLGLLLGRK